MDRVAQASAEERTDLFQRAAAKIQPQRAPAILEKDFWVCWTLRRVFEVLQFQPRLIFKGGTSLSKAYNAIERFSEDVDLSLSRTDLGFAEEHDPEEVGISKGESKRRLDQLVIACTATIKDRLLPNLRADFIGVLGDSGWSLKLDPIDPQTIIFSYPQAVQLEGVHGYIRPAIRLEMGARSDDWPSAEREIVPYAAEVFPEAFTTARSCRIPTLEAIRTFWEKATLLHAEYHRAPESRPLNRLSRHYYDLFMLAQLDITDDALKRLDLLERVVKHKRLFFASAWASYETATPGEFHLLPANHRIDDFRSDYKEMKAMIFGTYPEWDEIIEGVTALERRINALKVSSEG
jgi:hypothetical protein